MSRSVLLHVTSTTDDPISAAEVRVEGQSTFTDNGFLRFEEPPGDRDRAR